MTVEICADVTRRIRQHARTSPKAEICGVLIGDRRDSRVVVENCIQGVNASQGGAHVTFTQETWEHIYKVKDEEYPEQRIIGWYHSHPGFGVFLSEHDEFIQKNFFSAPEQIAWVYDPHTDEEGCFGWNSGRIERLPELRVRDEGMTSKAVASSTEESAIDNENQRTTTEDEWRAERFRPNILLRLLPYAAALLLGAAIVFFFFPRLVIVPIDAATGRIIPPEELRQMPAFQNSPQPGTPNPNSPSGAPK